MKLISNNVTPIDRNAICPCGSGRKYKKCCAGGNIGAQEAIPDLLPPPISSHEIEKLMKQVKEIAEDKNLSIKEMENLVVGKSFDEIDEEHGNLSHGIKNSPKRKAEELIWDAFEMSSGKKRLKLVENALEIYPYLPDAWMIIAEETANSFEEELVCFKHAVLAGEKDLGKEFFKENEGHFWGMHETRPYMRAKASLAETLWCLDFQDESIGHYQDCLRLNPNDNQGIRDLIVPKLLYKNDLKTAEKILKHYKSDWGAAHNFNLALILFKKEGPKSETAIKQLKKAIESNHHVPKFLTSKISLPKEIPDAYSHGSIEEAVIYMSTAVLTWVDAEGAIEWLHAYCGEQPKKRTKTKIKN